MNNSMIVENRSQVLDVAKAIGILFVIFAHVNHCEPFYTIIYSFHMPLFFVIAGINFHPEKYRSIAELIKRKIRTMLIPYLIFCLLGLFINLSYYIVIHNPASAIFDFLKKSVYSIIWAPYSLKYFTEFNTPMWFVPCLLAIELMYYSLCKISKKYVLFIVIALISSFGWIMEADIIHFDFSLLPWNFSSACFSLVFFAAGHQTKTLYNNHSSKTAFISKERIKLFPVLIVSALVTVVIGLYNGKVSIGSRILNNGFLFIVTGISGTISVLVLSHFLQNSKLLKFCGKNSFTIMGCHYLIFQVINHLLVFGNSKISAKIPIYDFASFIDGVLMFFLVALLSGVFVLLYNKCTRTLDFKREKLKAPQ